MNLKKDVTEKELTYMQNNLKSAAFSILLAGIIAVAGAVLLIEWASGCGESYVDSDGVRHELACVFMR